LWHIYEKVIAMRKLAAENALPYDFGDDVFGDGDDSIQG